MFLFDTMTTQKSWCQWTTHSTIMSICCWDLKQEITWTCDHVITWTWWIYIYSSLCGDSIFVSAALIGRINTGMVQDWSSFTKWCIKKKRKKERKNKVGKLKSHVWTFSWGFFEDGESSSTSRFKHPSTDRQRASLVSEVKVQHVL